jgi:uncharacterized cupin superfamily protein
VNLFSAAIAYDDDDPDGYHLGYARLAPEIGAALLAGQIYELPPGQSTFPYHYEWGNEEWLIVLAGRPTLRHPAGSDELEAGDLVCFPPGPDGAHKLTNHTEEAVRVVMLSTANRPAVAVYPDSDKIGVWPGDKRDDVIVRRESIVGYWDREL